ncbi:DUF1304 family protein [Mucilaginibacter celer]|uniref:DUF1304 family protein n=1 Tax=Mucilaginibacter celer TaxID=2305508 RepID=A0A494VSK4_9SPHI|nr:DUF1304 family protein [Mucilaginibacter celer]AYL94333.1 DUF1304 family protein [Mucilaginibacter celer]
MKRTTKLLVTIVIIVHFMFFLIEAIFWMQPFLNEQLLVLLNNPVGSSFEVQAITLRNLFINQGFYNLFIMLSGVTGSILINKRKYLPGYTLILFLCFCGTGAGIVLAFSTKAYLLAAAQALPALAAFIQVYPLFHNEISKI